MKSLLLVCFVVICVSIIAGLVISREDPLEQARKTQDEKMQGIASEFIQSTALYYSIHTGLPWFSRADNGANCYKEGNKLVTVPMSEMKECTKLLVEESSFRKDYLDSAQLKSFYVTNPNPRTGENFDIIVCYQPQSKLLQKDLNTRFNKDGTDTPPNFCKSQGGKESCYACTQ